MLTIIPIFLESKHDLWCGAEAKSLLLKLFSAAANAHKIDTLTVCTNDASIFDLSASHAIDTSLMDLRSNIEESALLPLGTNTAAGNLLRSATSEDEGLMVLGFRNPLVTARLLDEAITRFETSEASALISLKKSTDHPCQLAAYYNILDIGFLHLFDNLETTTSYKEFVSHHLPPTNPICDWYQANHQCLRLTKPFYLDWHSKGIKHNGAPRTYVRIIDSLKTKYIPLETVQHQDLLANSPSFWLYEDSNTARVLFTVPDPYQQISTPLHNVSSRNRFCSCPAPNDEQLRAPKRTREKKRPRTNLKLIGAPVLQYKCGPFLLQDTENGSYMMSFQMHPFPIHTGLLRLLPIPSGVQNRNQVLEIELSNLSEPVQIHLDHDDVSGMLYSLLTPSVDDTYDLQELFHTDNGQWTISSRPVNLETQKEITGRQDLPDVFEPDGTFCIMKKGVISSLDAEIAKGRVGGFVIQDTDALQISSWFDILRYTALSRATGKHYEDFTCRL